MSQSVKAVARSQKINKRGMIPIYIRVIVHRRTKFISLGYSVRKEDWDEKKCKIKNSHPNFHHLNVFISKRIFEIERLLLESEIKSGKKSLDSIFKIVTKDNRTDFYSYAKMQIEKEKGKAKIGTLNQYNTSISKLKQFTGKKSLFIEDMNSDFFEKYSKYLKEEFKNNVNTIHNSIKFIRKWIKQAVRERIILPENDPFLNFKLKRGEGSRVPLTEEEVKQIELLEAKPGTRLYDSKNLFLLSFYCAGTRCGDMLQIRFKNIQDGKLYLTMQKTGKRIGIKLTSKAFKIIDAYRTPNTSPDDFVFPYLNSKIAYSDQVLFTELKRKTALVNKFLVKVGEQAGIKNKKLSTHIARHTFASISNKREVPIKYISSLLGHASVRTTEGYIAVDDITLDEYIVKVNGE